MGSGASSLPKDKSTKIAQSLKLKFEEYHAAGIADADIHDRLTKEYHSLVAAHTAEKPHATEENSLRKGAGHSETSSSTSKLTRASFEAKPAGATRASFEGKPTTTRGDSNSKIGLSSKGGFASASTKGGGGVRRRSFGVDDKKQNSIINKEALEQAQEALQKSILDSANEAAAEAAAAAVLAAAAAIQQDSWDSVTAQPFCTVCQMAFKSTSFLDRHVKYSDLHIKNVQKQADLANPKVAVAITLGADDELFKMSSPSGKMQPKQVEGKHYRLIYSGSKLFWRTQETVDLNIYHHIIPFAVEVVSYDTVKCKELNRLYLDYGQLCDQSGISAAHSASAGAKAAAARAQAAKEIEQKNAKGDAIAKAAELANAAVSTADIGTVATHLPATNGATTEEEDEAATIARFIIQRLQLGNPVGTSTMKTMEFVKLSSDVSDKPILLPKMPVTIIPIAVPRRRRTNAEEIEATINNLATDRAALVEATGHAHKVANAVYTSATSLAAKKWWANFNPVRKKWIWAIRRVIRQKLVAETTEVLLKLEQAKKMDGKKGSSAVGGVAKEV